MTPNATSAGVAPGAAAGTAALLDALADREDAARDALRRRLGDAPMSATASVDLRRSAWKVACVDTNAFPAGFNNVCAADRPQLAAALRASLDGWRPGARRVGVVAEAMTRNAWYAESVAVLRDALVAAGFEVAVLATGPPLVLDGTDGARVETSPLVREGDRLVAGGRPLDAAILNSDLSGGLPPELDGLAAVSPPPALGWWRRSKRHHVRLLSSVVADVAAALRVDPWLLDALHGGVGGVDFRTRDGLPEVAERVDALLAEVQAKYDGFGVRAAPTAFVKADRGTFGIGVLPVASGRDVLGMNARTRAWMARGQQGIAVRSVLVQEAVPTVHRLRGHPSEPVLYMVGGRVVGSFARLHGARGDAESLNAPGARFVPDCAHAEFAPDDAPFSTDGHAGLYRLLAESAAVALALEARELAVAP